MKIQKSSIIFLLLILPFLEPQLFKEIESIDKIFSLFKIIVFVIVLLMYIRKNKVSPIVIVIGLSQIVLVVATILSKGDLSRVMGPSISIVAVSILTDMYMQDHSKQVIQVIFKILFLFMIINLVSLLMYYPTGIMINSNWSPVYFLGIDNRFVFVLLPLVFFSLLYSIYKYNKVNIFSWIVIILSLISVFSVWSVGAMVGMSILVLYNFFIYPTRINKKLSLKFYIVLILILNISIVVFKIQDHIPYIFEIILKKDLTFTGRVFLWDTALDIIKHNPFLGIGVQSADYLMHIFNGVTHPHNLLLSITYQSGIVGLALFFTMLFMIAKKLFVFRKNKISSLFSITIFIILFLSLADSFDVPITYVIYVMGYNIAKIIKSKEDTHEKDRDYNLS